MDNPNSGPLHGLLRANRSGWCRLEGHNPCGTTNKGGMGGGRTRVSCLLREVRALAAPETLKKLLDNNRTHPIASKNDNK